MAREIADILRRALHEAPARIQLVQLDEMARALRSEQLSARVGRRVFAGRVEWFFSGEQAAQEANAIAQELVDVQAEMPYPGGVQAELILNAEDQPFSASLHVYGQDLNDPKAFDRAVVEVVGSLNDSFYATGSPLYLPSPAL